MIGHLALISNSQGGALGVITLEDVIEELIGEVMLGLHDSCSTGLTLSLYLDRKSSTKRISMWMVIIAKNKSSI